MKTAAGVASPMHHCWCLNTVLGNRKGAGVPELKVGRAVIVMTVKCSSSWCDMFIDFNRLLLTYTFQVKNKSLEMNCLSLFVSILNKTGMIVSSFFQCSKQIRTTMINFCFERENSCHCYL